MTRQIVPNTGTIANIVSPAVQRSLVSDQVFRLLAESILTGRYGPGELLPTQRALAAEHGVNMASVREAVKRLEQLHLVESRQGEGMRVRDWRFHGGLDVITHLLFQAGGFDPETSRSLFEARTLMLREAARLAADRRSEEQSEQLAGLAVRFAAEKDPTAAQGIDFEFFSVIVDAADNVVFRLIMNSIRDIYFDHAEAFTRMFSARGRLGPLYEDASRAIAEHDPAAAARAVEAIATKQARRLTAK
ncbi:MAG: FadR family transcriptional regulator [Thermoleophilaceae bacterium]|nr:FadR family transcriptional regulator [Thermoleophilaceae bacterium]